jgi:hypothetical protein
MLLGLFSHKELSTMSDNRRGDRREAGSSDESAPADTEKRPDTTCSELPSRLLIKFQFARDEFDEDPKHRDAIAEHIETCAICRGKIAALRAAMAATIPTEQATEWAWGVLKAAAEREAHAVE